MPSQSLTDGSEADEPCVHHIKLFMADEVAAPPLRSPKFFPIYSRAFHLFLDGYMRG